MTVETVKFLDLSKGSPIKFKMAPCQPGGEVSSDGQEESKEATCRCPNNPSGCCVDGQNMIIPLQLKE